MHFLLFVYFIIFLPGSFCERAYASAHAINPPGRRRIFEINSRPKINSHEEKSRAGEPSRHPNRWLRAALLLLLQDKTFQPSFISFVPPGLSILPLSKLLTFFFFHLAPHLLLCLVYIYMTGHIFYSRSLRASHTRRRLYYLQNNFSKSEISSLCIRYIHMYITEIYFLSI